MRNPNTTRPGRRLALVLTAALAVAVTGACSSGGSGGGSAAKAVAAGHSEPAVSSPLGDPVPAPTGDPVLKITGRIGATNGSGELALDRAMLERLGARTVDVFEPFQKTRMSFQGLPFAALLEALRLDPAASGVHMVALDDFTADLSMADAGDPGTFLATAAGDGSPIPVEKGGPVRLIFLDGSRAGSNVENWIWSMATVEIK